MLRQLRELSQGPEDQIPIDDDQTTPEAESATRGLNIETDGDGTQLPEVKVQERDDKPRDFQITKAMMS